MSAPDKITVTIDDSEREIFMSFGLLNDLTTIVADPGRVAAIPLVPELRLEILNAALAGRRKNGKIENKVDVTDLDISIDDAERLLHWVSDHVMSFFVRSLQNVEKVTQAHKTDLEGLVSSFAGSKNSASKNPSSGPSE